GLTFRLGLDILDVVLVALRIALALVLVVIVGGMVPFLSASVAVVFVKRIPAALYDIELNASVTALVTRLVFGADAADCGTFCHRRTPCLQTTDPAETGAEKTKTPQAGRRCGV